MTQFPFPTGASPPGAPPGVIALGPALVRWTARSDGDMGDPTGSNPETRLRRRAVLDRPWSWLVQVHGVEVAVADGPGGAAGRVADGVVSAAPGVALAILTADCAPVAFASPEGIIGVAHAGWRGLVGGIIEETVASMRRMGARSVWAALGPCIHSECYPFGPDDLDLAEGRLGAAVRGEASDGHLALDIPRAVQVTLDRAGADLRTDAGICTACSADHWSWRARQDQQRQATVVWLP